MRAKCPHPHCVRSPAPAQVASQQEDEAKNRKLVKGALDTLRDLDLGPFMLLSFAQEVLAQYGNSDDAGIRKAAALAAWRVVERQWALLKCEHAHLPKHLARSQCRTHAPTRLCTCVQAAHGGAAARAGRRG